MTTWSLEEKRVESLAKLEELTATLGEGSNEIFKESLDTVMALLKNNSHSLGSIALHSTKEAAFLSIIFFISLIVFSD